MKPASQQIRNKIQEQCPWAKGHKIEQIVSPVDSIEIYAWAPKPYHKFMAFKSFSELQHKPLLVDLTVEEGTRLKVLYGSQSGFHAVDLDSAR